MLQSPEDIIKFRCKYCGLQSYHITISAEEYNKIENFPFTCIVMHTSKNPQDQSRVHTLILYVDAHLKVRDIEYLSGQRVFITPYIQYNPSLLQLYFKK